MYSSHWGMSACAQYEAGPLMSIWSDCSDTVYLTYMHFILHSSYTVVLNRIDIILVFAF
jgi:hypothetical protein